jgi:hypothetical protein
LNTSRPNGRVNSLIHFFSIIEERFILITASICGISGERHQLSVLLDILLDVSKEYGGLG